MGPHGGGRRPEVRGLWTGGWGRNDGEVKSEVVRLRGEGGGREISVGESGDTFPPQMS